ncbi:BPI fold-containing family B member 4 [Columba guinea]|nr:BPI fold-containing family B member 4 [Columba guinea]
MERWGMAQTQDGDKPVTVPRNQYPSSSDMGFCEGATMCKADLAETTVWLMHPEIDAAALAPDRQLRDLLPTALVLVFLPVVSAVALPWDDGSVSRVPYVGNCSVLSKTILQSGLLQRHLQGLVLPSILGNGGLLSAPTSITGLHLVRSQLPRLSVTLLSGIGVQLSIAAELELRGNCLVGLLSDLIDISVAVNITANIKCTNFESGTVQVVIEDCLCILGAIKINLLSGTDLNSSQLNAVMTPVGTAGTIHYQLASLPFTSGLFLELDLDGVVQDVGGSIIPHDSSPSALPLLLDNLFVMGVRQGFLNAVVVLMFQIPTQNLTCAPGAFSGASQLQEAIMTLAPTECSVCHGTHPLSIQLALAGNPLILLEENQATLKLSVLIRVFVNLDGSILNLLLLKADLGLNVHVSIAGGKLVLGLSLGSTSISLESSDVGISDISMLQPHCSSLLAERLVPLLNRVLEVGIPLPNVLDIPLLKVDIQILAGLLVIVV